MEMNDLLGLNAAFGPVAPGTCRISLKGDIAVKTDKGYRAFDTSTKKLVNVTDFCVDLGNMFVIYPTRKLKVADIVLFDGRLKCVTEVVGNGSSIKALDYGTATIEELIPEQHLLFGKKFYGKVVSFLGNVKKGGSRLVKLSLITKALGNGTDASGLMPLMLMGGFKGLDDGGEDGMIKTFLLAKCFGGNAGGAGDINSLLPLMLLGGKGEGDMTKALLLSQMAGGANCDMGKLLMFQALGDSEGEGGLFDGILGDDDDDDDEAHPEAPAPADEAQPEAPAPAAE